MTRLALLIAPLVLVSCASDQQQSVNLLNRRLAVTMAPEIADNRVALQPLPDGAQVTLLDSSSLPDDVGALDNRTRDPRASMIQGLLDPSLMRIQVADTSDQPDYVREKRVQAFEHYMEEYRLGSTLQTAEVPVAAPVEGAAAPPGLAIAIHVDCPHRTMWPGYGQGQSDPSCH